MSVILGVTVPEYPHCDKSEPGHLFCCNFLLHRKYGNLKLYYGQSEQQSPLEKLVETIRMLHLCKLPAGSLIMPGDLIVIFKGDRNRIDIRHSMIAITPDIWFGASNYFFFSHVFKNLTEDTFTSRDGVSTLMLGIDKRTFSFGQFQFDVWREEKNGKPDIRE